MQFSQTDQLHLGRELLALSQEHKADLGESFDAVSSLSVALLHNVTNVKSAVFNETNRQKKFDEKARTIVFYSLLRMLGKERLSQVNHIIFAKEAGLKLGLNAIGVDQVLHQLRTGKTSVEDFQKIVEHFKLYLN